MTLPLYPYIFGHIWWYRPVNIPITGPMELGESVKSLVTTEQMNKAKG